MIVLNYEPGSVLDPVRVFEALFFNGADSYQLLFLQDGKLSPELPHVIHQEE